MQTDPTRLLRGLAKLAGVVLAAGFAGAAIGIGLAKLTDSEESDAPEVAASSASAAAATATATPAATSARVPYREPRLEVLSAELGAPVPDTGRARVSVRISVTNRNGYPLKPRTPLLESAGDEMPLDDAARDAAGPLLRPVEPNATATGDLRFTVPAAVAQRLGDGGKARLRIAGRTITLPLAVGAAVE